MRRHNCWRLIAQEIQLARQRGRGADERRARATLPLRACSLSWHFAADRAGGAAADPVADPAAKAVQSISGPISRIYLAITGRAPDTVSGDLATSSGVASRTSPENCTAWCVDVRRDSVDEVCDRRMEEPVVRPGALSQTISHYLREKALSHRPVAGPCFTCHFICDRWEQ